jgi:hypothetical protein
MDAPAAQDAGGVTPKRQPAPSQSPSSRALDEALDMPPNARRRAIFLLLASLWLVPQGPYIRYFGALPYDANERCWCPSQPVDPTDCCPGVGSGGCEPSGSEPPLTAAGCAELTDHSDSPCRPAQTGVPNEAWPAAGDTATPSVPVAGSGGSAPYVSDVASAVLSGNHVRGTVRFAVDPRSSKTQITLVGASYDDEHHSHTSGHKWHIHALAVAHGDCATAGGHWDLPGFHTEHPAAGTYTCLRRDQTTCFAGDLSGKYGLLELPHQGLAAPRMLDDVLPAPSALVGKSIVVHGANGNGTRLACGTICTGLDGCRSSTPNSSSAAACVQPPEGGVAAMKLRGRWLAPCSSGCFASVCERKVSCRERGGNSGDGRGDAADGGGRVCEPDRSTMAWEWGLTCGGTAKIGLLGVVYYLGVLLGGFLGGPAAERFGRRRVVCWGELSCGLLTLLSAKAPSFAMYALGQLVQGVLGSVCNIAGFTLAAELCGPSHRTKWSITAFAYAWSVMCLYMPGFAYLFTGHGESYWGGWRGLQLLGGLAVAVHGTALVVWCPESPRWQVRCMQWGGGGASQCPAFERCCSMQTAIEVLVAPPGEACCWLTSRQRCQPD